MLGFVIEDVNYLGFVFQHPKFSAKFVFWNVTELVSMDVINIYEHESPVYFATLEHFISAFEALSQIKLKLREDVELKDLAHILCDPNTKFCLNQNKDA